MPTGGHVSERNEGRRSVGGKRGKSGESKGRSVARGLADGVNKIDSLPGGRPLL
jgi:hypothetical protein